MFRSLLFLSIDAVHDANCKKHIRNECGCSRAIEIHACRVCPVQKMCRVPISMRHTHRQRWHNAPDDVNGAEYSYMCECWMCDVHITLTYNEMNCFHGIYMRKLWTWTIYRFNSHSHLNLFSHLSLKSGKTFSMHVYTHCEQMAWAFEWRSDAPIVQCEHALVRICFSHISSVAFMPLYILFKKFSVTSSIGTSNGYFRTYTVRYIRRLFGPKTRCAAHKRRFIAIKCTLKFYLAAKLKMEDYPNWWQWEA